MTGDSASSSEGGAEKASRCQNCEEMIDLNKESYTTVQAEKHPEGIGDGFFLCEDCSDALWKVLGVETLG